MTPNRDPAPLCPLCAGPNVRPAFAKRGYRHFQCTGCASIFMTPAAVSEETCPEAQACIESSRDHMRPWWQRALDMAESRNGRGPLLDIGCGAGQFLRYASAHGWRELTGIEHNPNAAARAEQTGAAVLMGDVLQVHLPENHFAAVTLWDVIEHVSAPHALLERIARILRPGGVTVIATYNRNGLTMRLLGSRAISVMPPEHVLYPTRRGLAQALVHHGFHILTTQTFDIYLRDWLQFLSPKRPDAAYETGYAAATTSRAAGTARTLLNPALNALGLGDELLVAATKKRDRLSRHALPSER